jgi:hypothetical protein
VIKRLTDFIFEGIMQLELVDNKQEIRNAAEQYRRELLREAIPFRGIMVGFRHGSNKMTVYYRKADNFWFSWFNSDNKYWVGFGLGYPKAPTVTILAELNVAYEGNSRAIGAAFGKSGKNIYLLSRGKLSGGATGVGKNAFLDSIKDTRFMKLKDAQRGPATAFEKVLPLGLLGKGDIPKGIKEYLGQVWEFKKGFLKGEAKDKHALEDNDDKLNLAGLSADALSKFEHEGGQMEVTHLKRERNPKLRAIAFSNLRKKGPVSCSACGFNFDKYYGEEIGRGVGIVFHHLQPLSQGYRKTTPADLLPLCPNCHWAIHSSRTVPLSLKQLKSAIHRRN